MQELTDSVKAMQERSHRRLDDALHSPRFREFLLDVARCAQSGQWRQNGGGLFVDLARSELDRRLRPVKKKRKAVRGPDALKRHRLRIEAKKLRYMFEFMNAADSWKSLSAERIDWQRLQELLGHRPGLPRSVCWGGSCRNPARRLSVTPPTSFGATLGWFEKLAP